MNKTLNSGTIKKKKEEIEWKLTDTATIVYLIILITKMKIRKNVVSAVQQIQKKYRREIRNSYLFLFSIYIALCYNKKKKRKIDTIMKKKKKVIKIIFISLGLFLVIFCAVFGFFFTQGLQTVTQELDKTFEVSEAITGDETAIEKKKPMTILLMGVDTGSNERPDDWQGNSDTILLVTINPETKRMSMTSLERDLMTNIEGQGKVKLNAAYPAGGVELSISTVQKMLDVNIDYYALINMRGLMSLVDAVGGIEVTNHFDFPISIAKNEPITTAEIPPGTHLINGEQALVYSRMRYDDPDGDYGRQKRQREVIQKLLAKLLSLESIERYKPILSAISHNMKTNMDLGETSTLISLLSYKDSMANVSSYQLGGNGVMVDGVSYQVASVEDVMQAQNRIKKELGIPQISKEEVETNLVTGGDTISPYTTEAFSDPEGKNTRTMADIVNGR